MRYLGSLACLLLFASECVSQFISASWENTGTIAIHGGEAECEITANTDEQSNRSCEVTFVDVGDTEDPSEFRDSASTTAVSTPLDRGSGPNGFAVSRIRSSRDFVSVPRSADWGVGWNSRWNLNPTCGTDVATSGQWSIKESFIMATPIKEIDLFFEVFSTRSARRGEAQLGKLEIFDHTTNDTILTVDLLAVEPNDPRRDYRNRYRERFLFPRELQGTDIRLEFSWAGTMPRTQREYSSMNTAVWLVPEPKGCISMMPAALLLLATRRRKARMTQSRRTPILQSPKGCGGWIGESSTPCSKDS